MAPMNVQNKLHISNKLLACAQSVCFNTSIIAILMNCC